MPNIKSAIKKVRKDSKREKANMAYKNTMKQMLKNMSKIKGKDKKDSDVSGAYKIIDKAVKKGIIHKNKAARLKSQVGR